LEEDWHLRATVDPEGQQRHSTCRSVEARNRTWPWSVATATSWLRAERRRRFTHSLIRHSAVAAQRIEWLR